MLSSWVVCEREQQDLDNRCRGLEIGLFVTVSPCSRRAVSMAPGICPDYGGQGFVTPSTATRWPRTAVSVQLANRRKKMGKELEYVLWITGRGFTP